VGPGKRHERQKPGTGGIQARDLSG
jgi:hypothetical protein